MYGEGCGIGKRWGEGEGVYGEVCGVGRDEMREKGWYGEGVWCREEMR